MSELPLESAERDGIASLRNSRRNPVSQDRPSAFFVEPERLADGTVAEIATLFLVNKECPFRCVYCDLWKNTTEHSVPIGAIPKQISLALADLPASRHIKLYNAGNFFDRQAIPPEDYGAIAELCAPFETVIVENHPRLTGPATVAFRDLYWRAREKYLNSRQSEIIGTNQRGEFEIAMGLETVHPKILPRLNKQMDLDDFRKACEYLLSHGIHVRAFILLQPPYMPKSEAVEWAVRSVEFARECGVRVMAVIPTRGGEPQLETLALRGEFCSPKLADMEAVVAQTVARRRDRVFVDLWDVDRFYDCSVCGPSRADRLNRINLTQELEPAIDCSQCNRTV